QRKRRAPDAPTRKTQGRALLAEVVNRLVQRPEAAHSRGGAAEWPVQTLVLLGEYQLEGEARRRRRPGCEPETPSRRELPVGGDVQHELETDGGHQGIAHPLEGADVGQ